MTTEPKPFPRFFRHVAWPLSVYVRFNGPGLGHYVGSCTQCNMTLEQALAPSESGCWIEIPDPRKPAEASSVEQAARRAADIEETLAFEGIALDRIRELASQYEDLITESALRAARAREPNAKGLRIATAADVPDVLAAKDQQLEQARAEVAAAVEAIRAWRAIYLFDNEQEPADKDAWARIRKDWMATSGDEQEAAFIEAFTRPVLNGTAGQALLDRLKAAEQRAEKAEADAQAKDWDKIAASSLSAASLDAISDHLCKTGQAVGDGPSDRTAALERQLAKARESRDRLYAQIQSMRRPIPGEPPPGSKEVAIAVVIDGTGEMFWASHGELMASAIRQCGVQVTHAAIVKAWIPPVAAPPVVQGRVESEVPYAGE